MTDPIPTDIAACAASCPAVAEGLPCYAEGGLRHPPIPTLCAARLADPGKWAAPVLTASRREVRGLHRPAPTAAERLADRAAVEAVHRCPHRTCGCGGSTTCALDRGARPGRPTLTECLACLEGTAP